MGEEVEVLQKKSTRIYFGCSFPVSGCRLALCRVVLLAANFPKVSTHGFLAVGKIFLRLEVSLILRHVHQVVLTLLDSSANGCEASLRVQLLGTERRGTFVTVCFEGVDALTVGVRGCRSAVGGNEIVTVVVTILFFRSFQGAGDGFDTRRTYFHNCHFLPTMFHLRSA